MATSNSQLRLSVSDSSVQHLQPGGETKFLLAAEHGATIVGREVNANIQLLSQTVSRRHAVIEHDGDQWKIRDLGSKGGTRVNQVAVSASQFRTLRSGDELQLGSLILNVHVVGDIDATSKLPLHGDEGASDRTSIVARDLPGSVSAIAETELSGLAQFRLGVLLQSAASLTGATDLGSLAKAITKSAANGNSSPRAILIGTGEKGEWVVLGQYPAENSGTGEIEISRSLVALAKQGRIAQLLAENDDSSGQGKSILNLNIRSAICVPLVVDECVAAVLYLDTRGNEKPIKPDAAAFCVGLAQLGGMALANLRRAELARQEKAMRDELVAARTAQQQMIPDSIGDVGSVRYALEAVPGTIVAGDLFDIVLLDEDCTMVLLGDVMGKGAAAGLMMATVQTYFRARSNSQIDLSQLLGEANSYFHARFKGQGFVTLWIGMFQASSRRLRYIDAGHGHWCVFQQLSGFRSIDSQGGPPLGAFSSSTYALGELVMQPSDRIIIFSDGLVEQQDDRGTIFGETEALKCLSASHSALEDVQLLLKAHDAFRGPVPLSDDLTIASIELIDKRIE